MLSSLNLTDILIALITGYLAVVTTKKNKEPESNKLILYKYTELYNLVEKQRNEQTDHAKELMAENKNLNEQVSQLSDKVDELELREFMFRNIIQEITGLSYEEYLKSLKHK